MIGKKISLFSFFLILLSGFTFAANCGDLINSDTLLTDNITNCVEEGVGLSGSNFVFDCDNYAISGVNNDTSYGIWVSAGSYNLTIQNCIISSFNTGIYVDRSTFLRIINNTIYHNGQNLVDYSGSENLIMDNTIQNTTSGAGINIVAASNDTIKNNNIKNNYYAAIALNPAYDTVVEGGLVEENCIGSTTWYGIYLGSGSNNKIQGVSVINNNCSGIMLNTESGAVIANNTISNNRFGIELFDSIVATIFHNNIYGNFLYGISSNAPFVASYNSEGNYWGHASCPLFTAGIDSNDASVVDSYPYNESDGWNVYGAPPDACPAPVTYYCVGATGNFTCGDTVTESCVLNGDLTCSSGNGFEIGADDVTVNCDGHSIVGSGDNYGIYVSGRSGTAVTNCEISNFTKGVYAQDSNNMVIQNNILRDNDWQGIYIDGTGGAHSNHVIQNNIIYGNCISGGNTCGQIGLQKEDNCRIEGNNITGNSYSHGILLADSYLNAVSSNNISNSWVGIILTSPTDYDLGGFNTVIGNQLYNNLIGIGIKTNNNTIMQNMIWSDRSHITDNRNRGIDFRSANNGNVLSGNHVYNYKYGLYVPYSLSDLVVFDDEYYNNTYGIYLNGVSNAPIIANSNIHDNCEGLYTGSSSATVTDCTFTNNTCNGLHTASGSIMQLLNSNFYGGFNWGIFGESEIQWVVTSTSNCRNSNLNITDGFLVPFGGNLITDNCSIYIEGRLLNMTAGEQGSFSWPLDTTGGYGVLGGSEYGIEADVYTNEDFVGDIDIIFFTENPTNSSNYVMTPFGKYVKLEHGWINISSIILKIYYQDSEVIASGLGEDNLRIEYFNETSATWEKYDSPVGGVDTANNYVWANLTHFSTFGVFGSATVKGSGGGGGSNSCYTDWVCTEWSQCFASTQTRTCYKGVSNCNVLSEKPTEIQSCSVISPLTTVHVPTAEVKSMGQSIESHQAPVQAAVPGQKKPLLTDSMLVIGFVLLCIIIIYSVFRSRRTSN